MATMSITGRTQDSETQRAVRTCRCGQQLDVCVRAHCPRCGCTIGTSAFDEAGEARRYLFVA